MKLNICDFTAISSRIIRVSGLAAETGNVTTERASIYESNQGERWRHTPNDEILEKPAFVASWKTSMAGINLAVIDINCIELISDQIYSLLNIKRIFYVRHGEIQEKPLVFPADQEVIVFDII